jgi:hypothetical protein
VSFDVFGLDILHQLPVLDPKRSVTVVFTTLNSAKFGWQDTDCWVSVAQIELIQSLAALSTTLVKPGFREASRAQAG